MSGDAPPRMQEGVAESAGVGKNDMNEKPAEDAADADEGAGNANVLAEVIARHEAISNRIKRRK